VQWQRDGVVLAGATTPIHTVAASDAVHALRCTITATRTYGQGTATSAALAISAATSPGSHPGPGPGQAAPPLITRVWLSHRRCKEAPRAAQITRAQPAPIGTTMSFALNGAATVRIAFRQSVLGREVARRCFRASRHNRRRLLCTRRITTRAALALSGHVGANTITFIGRLPFGGALRTGSYVTSIVASIADQNSRAAALRFTIVA
jgi:hypothetical protein